MHSLGKQHVLALGFVIIGTAWAGHAQERSPPRHLSRRRRQSGLPVPAWYRTPSSRFGGERRLAVTPDAVLGIRPSRRHCRANRSQDETSLGKPGPDRQGTVHGTGVCLQESLDGQLCVRHPRQAEPAGPHASSHAGPECHACLSPRLRRPPPQSPTRTADGDQSRSPRGLAPLASATEVCGC
jgi:hypothetical protein